ncbi:MAG: hypothetical protein ACRCUJ_01745 [Phocaeicola sp.]
MKKLIKNYMRAYKGLYSNYKKITRSCTERLEGYSVRCTRLTTALIMICALLGASCKSSQQTVRELQQTDSVMHVKRVEQRTEAIPMSEVKMEVTKSQLDSLPVGVAITQKSGQATATLRKDKAGTIIVISTCDSLQQIIYLQEEELVRIRDRLQKSEEVTPCTPTLLERFWIGCGKLLLTLLSLYLIYIAIRIILKTV